MASGRGCKRESNGKADQESEVGMETQKFQMEISFYMWTWKMVPAQLYRWILGCSSKPMPYKSPLHFLTFSNQIRFPSWRDTSVKYQLKVKEKVIGLDKTVTR